jgi:hypothetical protein
MMSIIEFFDDLNLLLTNHTLYDNLLYLGSYALIFFANLSYYLLYLIKFYKIICFTKITFDGLPMINPYIWPFSIFRVLTKSYFAFWARIIPPIKYGKSSFDISIILGIEALSSIIYLLTQMRYFLLFQASELITKM